MFVKYFEPVDIYVAFENAIKHKARYMAYDHENERCVITYSHISMDEFVKKYMNEEDVYTCYFQNTEDTKKYWSEYQRCCDYYDVVPW